MDKLDKIDSLLFEKSSEARFILKKGKVINSNRHARRIFRCEEDKWIGFDPISEKNGIFNYLPDEYSLLLSKLTQARISGRVIKINVLAKRIDGDEFHSEIKIAQISKGIEVLQVRDVSEIILYDSAIKESEARYRVLSQFAMEGIVFISDGIIQDSNKQFAAIFGHDTAPIGVPILDFIDERDWQRLSARRNWGVRCELRGTTKQGRSIYLEATRSEIKETPNTKLNEQILMVYDITDRKRTEFDLLQTKERFRMLVESSPIGLFLVLDKKIKYTNAGGLELLNESVEDYIYDEVFTDFFHNNDKIIVKEDIEKIRKGERPPYREVIMVLRDGTEKEVGLRMSLSFHDRSPAIQITVTDLSTRVQLVREQMRATLAEESNIMFKEEIRKHKITQQNLIKAEEFNRSIIESSIDMIVAFDMQGYLQQYNHAFSVEFGIEPGKEKSINYTMFIPKEDEINGVVHALQTRSYFSGEVHGKRLSGEVFSMFISVAMMKDASGEDIGAMAVGRDITDLKIIEEELKNSEEKHRDILDNATDIIFVVDSKGYFTYSNPSFHKKLGYTQKSLANTTIKDVIKNFPSEKNWINELDGVQSECVFIDSKGEELSLIGGSSAQHDENGKPIGMRGIYLDITEMKHLERDAKTQTAKLESIFNSTQNLIMFTLNDEDEITSFNDNFKRLMKGLFKIKAELGMSLIPLLKLFRDESYKSQVKLFNQALKGKANDFELPLKYESKEIRWYHIFLNPISNEVKQNEISCIAYDISERKAIDERIRLALKEKEVLLREVHHRVKNNLQVISSLMSLQKSFVDDPKLTHILDESQSRIATMSYIHESLYRNTDVSSISFAEYLERLSVNLINSYSTPDCDVKLKTSLEDVFLTLDQAIPSGLIVNELVSNALKYAFIGKKEGAIVLRAAKVSDKIEIEVSDNGMGLPENFELNKGDTLGLYLIQALAEQLNAELVVKSTEQGEVGSSFLIRFDAQVLK
ncbi:MAG: PAS domain S-box protein [Flavobacteriales bacterium]|nr:PAS domain S-box protein [Flavobacteriales bacterium]